MYKCAQTCRRMCLRLCFCEYIASSIHVRMCHLKIGLCIRRSRFSPLSCYKIHLVFNKMNHQKDRGSWGRGNLWWRQKKMHSRWEMQFWGIYCWAGYIKCFFLGLQRQKSAIFQVKINSRISGATIMQQTSVIMLSMV